MAKSQEQRVEELGRKVGGRFRLTTLVQKRVRDYHISGRTFMPNVRNMDELVDLVLEEIRNDQIQLRFPEEVEPRRVLEGGTDEQSEESGPESSQ